MRMLVVGGTRFVGRHIVEQAIERGHELTLLHRGRSGGELFPQARHILADRNGDLAALAGGEWDVTVDVSGYLPRQVRDLADALDERGGRYVYISSVSVYAGPPPGFTEDAALHELPDPTIEEISDETYGGLKAACERAALDRFGSGTLIVRPTYVVGPYDHLCRFTWWVERVARGGEILAPGPPDAAIQVIDARDLAAWTLDMIERGDGGVFHAAYPRPPFPFRALLEAMVVEVGPPGTTLTWVDPDFLGDRGVDADSLPLWSAFDPEAAGNLADPSAALAAGLSPRPLSETIRETHAHAVQHPLEPLPERLTPEREAALLAEWHQR
ncbi:NAD-dependent epimerase/dehydratase family protein [Dactylosporangium sp. AC04546]|uniref:NAD-dependent epimerase/dehydratase family protein n=1 Tax=Dactylosporangium sp. AC04546 TaxID=2862460 RepID=UPI001EE06104|nr:NAD-dependent epimerase/dehydratase family protein [Dactylosporangium sp. AC04546]WVK85557.1 NAD-dependent epimerase/dehydratase family protein [Dactylosporangium sp. AC04546]